MIVPDWVWRMAGHRWIEPFWPERVNPVSVDLTLSCYILLQRYLGVEYDNVPAVVAKDYRTDRPDPATVLLLAPTPTGESPMFHTGEDIERRPFEPGDSVLARTVETLRLPRWMRAQGMLKSSLAREGVNHRTALYIDPGFHGPVTLEINFDRSGHLVPHEPIIQVEGMVGLPHRPYNGHYQHLESHMFPIPNMNRNIAFQAKKHPFPEVQSRYLDAGAGRLYFTVNTKRDGHNFGPDPIREGNDE